MANDNQKRPGFSRRDFIKGAAVAAGGTVLGGVAAGAATGADVTVLGNAPRSVGKGPSVCDGSQDLALINGKFLTMDDKNSVVSAVAIRDGRIAEIGRHAQAIGPCAQTINLRGATVIPGLIDSHVHFIRCGINPGHEVRIIETATSIRRAPADDLRPGANGARGRLHHLHWRLEPKRLCREAPADPVRARRCRAAEPGIPLGDRWRWPGSHEHERHRLLPVPRRDSELQRTARLTPTKDLAALQAVQTEEDKQRGTAEVMDFASSLGLTMVHDHGGLSGLAPYQYALNLWRQGNLKVRQRPFFWSGDDPGFSVEQARIVNNFNRLGDDFWRTNGVGERLNTSTTNPGFVDACVFAAANGWTLTQHSSTVAEIEFHISAYQAAATAGPIDKFRWSLCHVNNITDDHDTSRRQSRDRREHPGHVVHERGRRHTFRPAFPQIA